MTQKFSLKKHEKLKSKLLLDKLFTDSSSVFAHPIKVLFLTDVIQDGEWPLLFSVSVPKRKIKSAVKRNLIKRRIREAYRLHKLDLETKLKENSATRLSIMLIYIESEAKEYAQIEKAVIKVIKKLSDALPS